MKIIAVTACTTGIAHTYMAADKLRQAAADAGITLKIETQGAMDQKLTLTQEEIDMADLVLIATDVSIKREERFSASHRLTYPIQDVIQDPNKVLADAIAHVKKHKHGFNH